MYKYTSRKKQYVTWYQMKRRCDNSNHPQYKDYGGRGITYCPRWKSLDNFIEDMWGDYRDGLQLDRVDNDGQYNKQNCRWVTREEQQNNTRRTIKITYLGQTLGTAQWARILGVNDETVINRVRKGLTIDVVLSTKSLRGKFSHGEV